MAEYIAKGDHRFHNLIKTLKSSFSLGKMSSEKLIEGQPPSYQATTETPQPQEAPPKYEPCSPQAQGKLGIYFENFDPQTTSHCDSQPQAL